MNSTNRKPALLVNRLLPVTIRTAEPCDAEGLAALCTELGCTVEAADIVVRLQLISRYNGGMVFVAVDPSARVRGFLHVAPQFSLSALPVIEILDLGVRVDARLAGVSWALVGVAEIWARDRGTALIQVRSDLAGDHADIFSCVHGWHRLLDQHLFQKALADVIRPPSW